VGRPEPCRHDESAPLLQDDGATAAHSASRSQHVMPLLSHLNLGSNRIGDHGVKVLVKAATRAPRTLLEGLSLTSNDISDDGAVHLAEAINAGKAFPGLSMLSMGGNQMGTRGEAALREACAALGVVARGVGVLRGAPVTRQPQRGSWVVGVAVDSADSVRSSTQVTGGVHA
jgi:hypothetical protein